MSHIILSLVGDQTLPNVLFILALPGAVEHWFLETEKTFRDKRTDSIIEACGIHKKGIRTMLIGPDALSFTAPEGWQASPETILYINLTGGTKMMALSVYRFYENDPAVRFYYSPINGQAALPLSIAHQPLPLPALNLKTHLLAQGYLALPSRPGSQPAEKAKNLYGKVLAAKSPGNVPEIAQAAVATYTGPDKKYLMGEWFEDYIYHLIKEKLGLPDSHLARGLRLQHIVSNSVSESDQELDVAFLYKNHLYIVECKVFLNKAWLQKVYDPIYKLGAINRTLGLSARAIACMLLPGKANVQRAQRMDYLRQVTNVHAAVTTDDFRKVQSVHELFNLK